MPHIVQVTQGVIVSKTLPARTGLQAKQENIPKKSHAKADGQSSSKCSRKSGTPHSGGCLRFFQFIELN